MENYNYDQNVNASATNDTYKVVREQIDTATDATGTNRKELLHNY